MKQFNKQQLDVLSEWEDKFFTATVGKYYRSITSKSLDKIAEVYNEVADNPVTSTWACNHCILDFLIKVGKKYFADKEALETSEKNERAGELVKALDQVFDEVQNEPEPKAVKKAAPKKSNKKATKKK